MYGYSQYKYSQYNHSYKDDNSFFFLSTESYAVRD